MPRRSVDIAPEALAAIQSDADYIRDELSNPDAAQRMCRAIMDRIKTLASHPEAGSPIKTESLLLLHYRFVVVFNRLIFYRVEKNCVHVVRVIYQRRDYERLLEGCAR